MTTICHVIGTLDPVAGGLPIVALSLASAQAALGHPVHVVTMERADRASAIDGQIASIPGTDRLLIHREAATGRTAWITCRRSRRALRKLANDLDVIHIHGVWDPLLVAAARLGRRRGIPYVIRPAGMLDPWSLSQRRLKKRLAIALVYRRMLSGAVFIHALNADERDLIEPLGITAPTEVHANGVFPDAIELMYESGRFRADHPSLGDRQFFIFIGRLHYKKGLDILGDAYADYLDGGGDWHLVVAGPDEGAREDFAGRIESKGLSDRVHLVGPLYGAEKYRALGDAGAFVLPSRQEGFSNAILEALAGGLPVVITASCHFPEVAESEAGLVTALDAKAFGTAMTRVSSDDIVARRMGKAGRQLVRQHYTWPVIAQQLLEAYRG